MSQSAQDINDALQLYRAARGTPDEYDAYTNLQRVVERVKQGTQPCCGGRCRWCSEWRSQ